MRRTACLLVPCLVAPALAAAQPPIVLAAYNGDLEGVQAQIAAKAELEAVDEYGWTALLFAVYQRDEAMVKALLKAGAKPSPQSTVAWRNGKAPVGTSPLGLAAFYGFTRIAEALVQAHADPALVNAQGLTPATIARKQTRYGVLEVLEPEGHPGGYAQTLEEAAYTDDFQAAARLIAAKTPLDEPGKSGVAPLLRAVFEGSDRVGVLLLDAGADPNIKAFGGGFRMDDRTTPLVLAAKYDRRELVAPLLKAKADPTFRDAKGRTPLELAKSYQYKEVVALLSDGH